LKAGGQLVVQAAGDVFLAPEPSVGQDKRGAKARPECALKHVPEEGVFGLLAGAAQIPGGRTALVLEGFVHGLDDAALLPQDELGFQGQEPFFGGQAQVQHLVSLAEAALGVVEVATGALDLAAGAGLAGVVDDEGALGPRPQVVGLADAAGQLAGQAPPINILPAQEIVEHADLAGQNLAQLGAEAVEGFDL